MKLTFAFTALAALLSSQMLVAAWDVAGEYDLDARAEYDSYDARGEALLDTLYARYYEALDARDALLDELYLRQVDKTPMVRPSSMKGKKLDSLSTARRGTPIGPKRADYPRVSKDTREMVRPSSMKGKPNLDGLATAERGRPRV